jgi:hypothetical protein
VSDGKNGGGVEWARETFQEHVADPARRAGERIRDASQKVVEHSSDVGVRIVDQAQANAHEAFAAMRAAASAKDLGEVMRIQGEYLREQGRRSMDHAREIGDLIMKFGRDAVAPVTGKDAPTDETPKP